MVPAVFGQVNDTIQQVVFWTESLGASGAPTAGNDRNAFRWHEVFMQE